MTRTRRRGICLAAIGAGATATGAAAQSLVAEAAQPRTHEGERVLSRHSIVVVQEQADDPFMAGGDISAGLDLLNETGEVMPGTSINLTAATAPFFLTTQQETFTIDLSAVGVVGILINSVTDARGARIHLSDGVGAASIDYALAPETPTLHEAWLDDAPGSERLFLRFDRDLTNGDAANDANQTTTADLSSIDDFEMAVDESFETSVILDAALISHPTLLEDRRTIRYRVDIPAAFDPGAYIRPIARSDITSITGNLAVGSAVLSSQPCPCGMDFTGDGVIDGADLGRLLGGWGAPDADLNGDGVTDSADLGLLLNAWGPCV